MHHKIEILDPVWAAMRKEAAQLANNALSFTKKKWGKGSFRDFETIRMIESNGRGQYLFPLGLIDRAAACLEEFGDTVEIVGSLPEYSYDDYHLEGITFRHYQERLIEAGLKHGRGVLKSPTASGKSIIILGLISAFSQENILFLCHTKDLVIQMRKHLEKHGFGPIGMWTGDEKTLERITVSTIQSYIGIAEEHVNSWDVVIIDEGHHVSSIEGQYVRALALTAAPVKLALTATMPYLPEAKMALEGYIGPLIAEYTIQEAGEDEVLAKPLIKIIKMGDMPGDLLYDETDFKGRKTMPSLYEVVYWNGIVKNFNRNLAILMEVEQIDLAKESVLINVERKEHGFELQRLAKEHFNMDLIFVYGDTENRGEILERFNMKDIRLVVATKVFNEGVDIQSLDCCINAAGRKSEIETLQKIGRGLRKTENKSHVTIIDFYDTCHPMLENQFFQRYKMYVKNGWVEKTKKTKK